MVLLMDAREVYVLIETRSADMANRFLRAFAEHRNPVATDFPFPEFADDPECVFDTPDDVITQLERRVNEPYAIYWNIHGVGRVAEQAMLFFMVDGGMIAGLGGLRQSVEETLIAIRCVVDGEYGYVTSGSCPPTSVEAFKSLCEKSTLANLFEGRLRSSKSVI